MIKPIILKGTSMKPFFSDGDVVLYNDNINVKLGDMILYKYYGKTYLHRVVGFKNNNTLVSNDDDMPIHIITVDKIIGKVDSFYNGFVGYLVHILIRRIRLVKKNLNEYIRKVV